MIAVVHEDRAGRALEGAAAHPLPMPLGPVRPGIAVAVAEEELGEPLARRGPIPPHVLARAHEVAHGLLARRRDGDRRELSAAVEAAELLRVPAIGLDALARAAGNQRRGDHVAVHPECGQLAVQPVAARPSLVARPDVAARRQPAHQTPDLRRVVRDRLDHRGGRLVLVPGDGDRCGMDIHSQPDHLWHGRLLSLAALAAGLWVLP